MTRWRSAERPPKPWVKVFAGNRESGKTCMAFWSGRRWFNEGVEPTVITHWLPLSVLPPLPKARKNR